MLINVGPLASTESARYKQLLALSGSRNGYGDYVRAAQIVARPENRPLIQYLIDSARSPQTPKPAGVPANLSQVELFRLETRQMSEAIALVRRGNRKRCSYPDLKLSAATLRPEHARFKDLARLFANAAEVAYKDGQPDKGSHLLFEGLKFTDQFEGGPLLSTLVAMNCRSILFKSLRNHFASLTRNDLVRLTQWSQSVQQKPSPFLVASIVERESDRRFWFQFCDDPKADLRSTEMPEPVLSKATEALQRLSQKRRGELYDLYLDRLETPWRAVEARLRQPETLWLDKLTVPAFMLDEASMAKMKDPPGVTLGILGYIRLYQALTQDDSGIDTAVPTLRHAVQNRIQARVVGLYAAVGQFRLQHHRLPKSLSEADVKTLKEPTTDRPYVYEPQADRKSFRIFTRFEDRKQGLVSEK